MKTSDKGRKFIQDHEGLRLVPYKVGSFEEYWTVGYGHYGPDVRPGVKITQKQAEQLLRKDFEKFEDAVGKVMPPVKKKGKDPKGTRQHEFDALVSLAFNLGPGVVSDPSFSTLARRLKTKEAETYEKRKDIYEDEFKKWVKAGGQTLPGLVTRREDETRLATKGRY
jgi:GH24 family phage-related lysozyme (muramidase)